MSHIVYFSSVTENTHRFVQKLGYPAHRIGLRAADPHLVATEPFVLIVPTYGSGRGSGAVPKQVIHFLNDKNNRALLLGVITGGNTNFGETYGLAGDIISAKCRVPHLYRFELMGTASDVDGVRERLSTLWQQHFSPTPAWNASTPSSTTTPSMHC